MFALKSLLASAAQPPEGGTAEPAALTAARGARGVSGAELGERERGYRARPRELCAT
jgi:hypothetical protein